MSSKYSSPKASKNSRKRITSSTPWSEWNLYYNTNGEPFHGRWRIDKYGDEEWDYSSEQSQVATTSSSPNVKYQHYDIEDGESAQFGYSSGVNTTYTVHSGPNNTKYGQSPRYSSGADNSAAQLNRTSWNVDRQQCSDQLRARWEYAPSKECAAQNDSGPTGQSYSVSSLSHDPTEFGRACDDLGLLKQDRDYWQAPDKYSTPASYWNEERLRNNCVFVTLGVLLGQTAGELSERINVPMPSEQETGIAFGTMERILDTLAIATRRGIHLVSFSPDWKWGMRPDDQQWSALTVLSPLIKKYKTKEFGLVYRRRNGNGHCIVVQIGKETKALKLRNCAFKCFQYQTDGEDKFEDVKESYFWAAIFLKPPSYPVRLEITHHARIAGAK